MSKTRTIGTVLLAIIVGAFSVIFFTPKKAKRNQEQAKKEQTNLFV